jgi:hypothetical protein
MNVIRIKNLGKYLSSRATGRRLREQILALADEDVVCLDFDEVRSVTHSFADEALAVLVEQEGEPWFRDRVKVINHSGTVRHAILEAIHYRLAHPRQAA